MSEDSIRRESRALIAAAKRIGAFLERSDVPGSRYTIRSGESEVRVAQVEQRYYDLLFVTDIGQDSDNVLVDDDGRLRFIDPIIGFKQPLQKLLNTEIESDEQIENLVRAICLGELNVRGK